MEASCVLAISFLNDQNCREKKEEMKAVTVKFTIAHLHKHAFRGIHKYLVILLDGRVFFVSHLPFKDYSTISTIYKTFLNVKLMKK